MEYPYIENIPKSESISTYFNGYKHIPSCEESAFYDTVNISTELFPILSTRKRRGKSIHFTSLQGLMDKEDLVWVDGANLYINNVAKTLASGVTISTAASMCPKTLAKMGAYIVILPDKIWYNTKDGSSGWMESNFSLSGQVKFTLVATDGTAITWHDASYYKPDGSHSPINGDYKMETINGKTSLMVYSSVTGLWSSVATTYMKIEASGIGNGIEEGDGIYISVNLSGQSWDYAKNIFVNDEGNGIRSSNFVIKDKGTNYVTVPALLNENKTFNNMPIVAKRKVPDMAFVTECQNRLWGCSNDGHEIYCCKLGDVKNWNVFNGISTDSWAATIGTDGLFTGAFTYLGYPIFFKEDSLTRITVSSVGAHQSKDMYCRGVESGSEKSLVMLDELLYYKASDGICVYDGNFPQTISDSLGEVRYHSAVGGSINGRCYMSMQSEDMKWHMFVFDKKHELWAHEDNIQAKAFARHDDDLYFVGADDYLYSVFGTSIFGSTVKEDLLPWMAESGNIGYYTANKKYVARINIRMFLEKGSDASVFIRYDSEKEWKFLYNMSGYGIKSFNIPITPRRCDHFSIRIQGHGDAMLYTITKQLEEGSDI